MPFRIAERMPALLALPVEAMRRKALIRAKRRKQPERYVPLPLKLVENY